MFNLRPGKKPPWVVNEAPSLLGMLATLESTRRSAKQAITISHRIATVEMRPSASLYLLALLFFFQSSTISAMTTLERLCHSLGADYVMPDYCINTLKTDPSSTSADVQGLGVIAANLTLTKATAIKSKLEELLKKVSNPQADKALEACNQLFSDLIPSLRWAANSMASKLNRGAEAVFRNALAVPASCKVPEITKENDAFSFLVNLARAIAGYLVA